MESHTNIKSFRSTRRENKRNDRGHRKQAVWQNEVNDVIQVSASQMNCECRTRVVEAAGIYSHTILRLNTCTHTPGVIFSKEGCYQLLMC